MSTPPPGPASQPSPEMSATEVEAAPKKRTCKCGHDRHHPMVSADPKYSGFGWAAILTGISWEPQSMSFKCRVCDQIIETIRDPAEMKKVRIYG